MAVYLENLRESAPLTMTCGIDGCDEEFSGPLADARVWRAEHRSAAHAGWEPPRTRRRRRGYKLAGG
jgi:hypothetical protein